MKTHSIRAVASTIACAAVATIATQVAQAAMPTRAALEPVALACQPSGDVLRFAPRPASRWTKKLEIEHQLPVRDMGTAQDDGPVIQQPTGGYVSTWLRAELTETYDQVEGGKVQRFVRVYDDLAGGGKANLVMQGSEQQQQLAEQHSVTFSPLHKRAVAFTWIEAEQGFARMYDSLDGEESLLAEVDFDTAFARLLGGREIALGESWTVPAEVARTLLAPGGTLALEPKVVRQFPRTHKIGVGGDLAEVLQSTVGPVKATFASVRDVDGVRCGVVEIELHVTGKADRVDVARAFVPENERREPAKLKSCNIEVTVKGRGQLLWDLERAHFKSFHFDGDETVSVAMSSQILNEGEVLTTMHQTSSFDGKLKVDFTAAEAPAPEAGKQ